MREIKNRVYPSSSAFMDGGRVDTQYSSGCMRMILAKAAGLKSDIPEKYMIMGELNELNFYQYLVRQNRYSVILDEVPVRQQIVSGSSGSNDVFYSGRVDFLTWEGESTVPVVHECKSSMSSGTLGSAKRGEIKLNQLAQLVSYMVIHDLPLGYLWLHGYSEKKIKGTEDKEIVPKIRRDTKEQHEYRFEVTFSDTDEILVDGRLSGFLKMDYVRHLAAAADLLSYPSTLPERPISSEDERGCCAWCDLKEVCNSTDDKNNNVDEFLHEALLTNTGE